MRDNGREIRPLGGTSFITHKKLSWDGLEMTIHMETQFIWKNGYLKMEVHLIKKMDGTHMINIRHHLKKMINLKLSRYKM